MQTNKTTPLLVAALGISLIGAAILTRQNPLFDRIANISLPYLAGLLGLAALTTGIHCALFASAPHELPLLPNVVLYILIAGAANVNIVWDGMVIDMPRNEIWLSLSNSLEFSIYYAAFLFLPKWIGKGARDRD